LLIKRNLVTLCQFQTTKEIEEWKDVFSKRRAFDILSYREISTISMNGDNEQERSRQCYISASTGELYIIWRGLLFITHSRQSRASR